MGKLNHYGVRGLSLDWFKSYLTNRQQKTSIKSIFSDSLTVSYGVPQGSILSPLLFLIYINDLNNAIAHSMVHHSADDTNIISSHKSLKKVNKFINHDLSLLVQWLQANRTSLNTSKTEIILLWTKNKKITKKLNFRISGQKVDTIKQTKYLGIYLDEGVTWKYQTEQIKSKQGRSSSKIEVLR